MDFHFSRHPLQQPCLLSNDASGLQRSCLLQALLSGRVQAGLPGPSLEGARDIIALPFFLRLYAIDDPPENFAKIRHEARACARGEKQAGELLLSQQSCIFAIERDEKKRPFS
jgi:hypothetical protein